MDSYDLIVIGSGPGGYVAAIRAAQLGMRVAVVERSELGGVCLNWGCIPTKALLKSAQVYGYLKHAAEYGIAAEGNFRPDLARMVERSRGVAQTMSRGVQYLLDKNKITILQGTGTLPSAGVVRVVSSSGETKEIGAPHIILATGARPRELPFLKIDGKRIISSQEALTLETLPGSMIVVGSGAIGCEFAHFYAALGTKVTIVEYLPNLMPLEDEEVSRQMERSFRKTGIGVLTGTEVKGVDTSGDRCRVEVSSRKGEQTLEADVVLSAVGIKSNLEDLGLEALGVAVERDKVVVDEWYRTSVPGIYAIGDIVPGPALAHVASAEAIRCVEKIAGQEVMPVDYGNIPSCIYTSPEVASVGLTEKAATAAGYTVKVGKFPYTASGKATAASERDGFVKLVSDSATDRLLGAHLVGANVTEMIAEPTLAKALGGTVADLIRTIHPHPTLSEALMEAAAAIHDEAIHL